MKVLNNQNTLNEKKVVLTWVIKGRSKRASKEVILLQMASYFPI